MRDPTAFLEPITHQCRGPGCCWSSRRVFATLCHQASFVEDLLSAATAMAFDASIVTRNPSDLAGLDELVDIIAV